VFLAPRVSKRYFEEVPKRKPATARTAVRPATELRDALRAVGLRRTGPRVAVLQRLQAAEAPLSHGDIAGRLSSAGFDRATVYRNLMDLVGVGLVTRTDLGDHIWRFELVDARGGAHAVEHPHFLCTDCGDVACLPDDAVRVMAVRGAPRAMGKERIEVQVKGRCDACAR
jgi:Fur family ferric uptake transcriptional regulator